MYGCSEMALLKHVAVGRFYRPMLAVAAGSVDLREANSVSRKQACLSDRWLSIFVFVSFRSATSKKKIGVLSCATPTATARTEAREARLNLY